MKPVRWCKACGDEEAAPRRQLCEECWLTKQPPVIRNEAAKRRLALVPARRRLAQVGRSKWPEGRRWCAGCQTFVRLVDCSGSRCRACTSIAQHLGRLKNEFGIDPLTYQHLFELQEGKCAICRGRPTTKRLAVDHDHACCKTPPFCGRCTRGLLCSRCNHELLGAAHDSLQILENAVTYLKTPPFSGAWSLPSTEVEANRANYGSDNGPAF